MGYPWPDNVRRGDPILASHVTTLRDEIKHQGDLAGLNPPITWTPSSINPGDLILASHFRDMRAAIQRLWDSKHRGPVPFWSSGVRPGGPSENTPPTPIYATDITDLRRWLDAYIDNHPRMGMDTKSYDAAARNRPLITISGSPSGSRNWIDDINDLQPSSPTQFMVRCIVTAPYQWEDPANPNNENRDPIPWTDADRDKYLFAFELLRQYTHVIVFADLPPESNLIGTTRDEINVPLDEPYSNPAIRTWAAEVRRFAAHVSSAGVHDFIIWNEPNYENTEIEAETFAALMYTCYNEVSTLPVPPRLYWGGVKLEYGDDNNHWKEKNTNFIKNVYSFIDAWTNTRPWFGLNVHIHGTGGDEYANNLAVWFGTEIRGSLNDHSTIIIGECGTTIGGFDHGHGEILTNAEGTGFLQLLYERFDLVCLFTHYYRPEDTDYWGMRFPREASPSPHWNDRNYSGQFFAAEIPDPTQVQLFSDLQEYWEHVQLSFQRLHNQT